MHIGQIQSYKQYNSCTQIQKNKKESTATLSKSSQQYMTGLPRSVHFKGFKVHIVDGGNHATNMQHFIKAIQKDADVIMHMVEVNKIHKNNKQLKSLEQELKILNSSQENFNKEYIAIPALATVGILNIQDQYRRVMGKDKKFTPENIKANKPELLEFLKKLYNEPSRYSQYIGYMDNDNIGIQHAYGIIQEINHLIDKGAQVYIPSGHPHDETLKWMADRKGVKPELYHYIATGYDRNNAVKNMVDTIKNNNWYNFNLLSLSNANIVGVKGTSGTKDYMFAAYDSCITDGARGVYNFSPVRDAKNQLIGYSYTDTTTNEYPFEEFPANEEVENLVKFVGKPLSEVIATKDEIENLKQTISSNTDTNKCADKLYPIKDIFNKEEIASRKLDLLGSHTDKSLTLFFSKNSNGDVIFPKCDCEGSGKPSVLSMWGSCFSIFNAISNDIDLMNRSADTWKNYYLGYQGFNVAYSNLDKHVSTLLKRLEHAEKIDDYRTIENLTNDILSYKKLITKNMPTFPDNTTPNIYLRIDKVQLLEKLINALIRQNKKDSAKDVLNEYIETLAGILKYKKLSFEEIPTIRELEQQWDDYYAKKREWENSSFLYQIFTSKPTPPYRDLPWEESRECKIILENTTKLGSAYAQIGEICNDLGEAYPARVCYAAAKDFKDLTPRAEQVLERRINATPYIGDLYNEIKP